MKLDINRSYKFITDDPEWTKKILIISGFYILVMIALFVFVFGGIFASIAITATGGAIMFPITIIGVTILAMCILLPFSFYMNGYNMEITKNVMHGDKAGLPALTPVMERMKQGGLYYVTTLPQTVILTIFSIPLGISYFGLLTAEKGGAIASNLIMLIVFGILYFIITLVIGLLITPAQYYLFIKGGFKEAFQYGKIITLMKTNFKNFAYIFLISFLGGLVVGAVTNIPLLGLAIVIFISQMLGHLYGQVYTEIDKQAK